MNRVLFAILLSLAFAGPMARAADDAAPVADPRNVLSGFVIPDEGYCDQPYVVVTKDGNWLCVLTTGAGKEGQRGQHVVSTTSKDQGRTWTKPVDIEPATGPEASWATPLITPSGRVYVFYDYNGDEVRTLNGKPARADMLGWYCYRYSDDNAASWSQQRFRLPMRQTACDLKNDWRGSVQIFWGISKPIVVGDSVLLAYSKLGKYVLDNGEGWFFRSENLLAEQDPQRLHWEMLPDGEHGLRKEQFGSVQEEHNVVPLSNGDLYCIYRTTQGYPCQAYSRDGGHHWTEPEPATYTPGGQVIKHPRACPKIWRTAGGKYLLWYHNHGGKTFQDRNPAWICGGVERDGHIHWSQGEVLLYDDDPSIRMSYPDLIEQGNRYWVTETQKTVARVHAIDRELLEGTWREVESGESSAKDAVTATLTLDAEQLRAADAPMPRLSSLDAGHGFSLELRLRLDEAPKAGTLLDATDATGRGLKVSLDGEGRIQLELSDGKTRTSWASDRGLLTPGREHHVVGTVDGGPKLITFVVDGRLCDGGTERQFGWGRFDKTLVDIQGSPRIKMIQPWAGELLGLSIYDRPLRNYEAFRHFHASRERARASN